MSEMISCRALISYTASRKNWFLNKSINLQAQDIWNSNNCKDVIKEYLRKAGTIPTNGSLAEILVLPSARQIDDNRYQHIIMTYFFGLAIYNNCSIIKDAIDREFCNNFKYDDALTMHKKAAFSYLWFLICLFHDLGYQYEYGKMEFEYSNFSEFKKDTMFEGKSIVDNLVGVPIEIYGDIIEKYFNFRKMNGKFDHGIIGGMQLYHDLCKIRETKYNDINNRKKIEQGYWRQSLEKVFAFASSVVVCHNIFFATKPEDENKYIVSGLCPLINTKKKHKITLQYYPVFFLFCLVDSIEPVKVVKDVDLLKEIKYDITSNSIKCQVKLKCGCRDRLIKNISELNDWLCPVNKGEDIYSISLN
jgi:hypothetical protein